MKTLILAAGYAVRLGALTKDAPKPFLKINGRRIIDRILDKISKAQDTKSIYIVTNSKFFAAFEEWLKNSPHRRKISLIDDGSTSNDTRLGAIKDLELVIDTKSIDDDLLVVAGDNLFDLDLNKFLKFAKEAQDGISVAVHDIKNMHDAKNFGVIGLDGKSRIIDFEEKPERPKSTLVSTGIYYFPKNKLPLIKKYVKMQDKKLDAPGYYISWAAKFDKVYGFVFSEDWCDIGNIESFNKADTEYKEKEGQRNG